MESVIEKKVSKVDCRRSLISLTEGGMRLAEKLIAESNIQISKELEGLSEDGMDKITYHMNEIIHILEGK